MSVFRGRGQAPNLPSTSSNLGALRLSLHGFRGGGRNVFDAFAGAGVLVCGRSLIDCVVGLPTDDMAYRIERLHFGLDGMFARTNPRHLSVNDIGVFIVYRWAGDARLPIHV